MAGRLLPVRLHAHARRIGSRWRFRAIAWFEKMEKWADIVGALSGKRPCCKWSSKARKILRRRLPLAESLVGILAEEFLVYLASL